MLKVVEAGVAERFQEGSCYDEDGHHVTLHDVVYVTTQDGRSIYLPNVKTVQVLNYGVHVGHSSVDRYDAAVMYDYNF